MVCLDRKEVCDQGWKVIWQPCEDQPLLNPPTSLDRCGLLRNNMLTFHTFSPSCRNFCPTINPLQPHLWLRVTIFIERTLHTQSLRHSAPFLHLLDESNCTLQEEVVGAILRGDSHRLASRAKQGAILTAVLRQLHCTLQHYLQI
jgi:hypothetical protein